MKKTIIIICLASATLISRGQTWSTTLNSGTDLKLGTSDNHPLDVYTNSTKMITIGTNGSMQLRSYNGTGNSLAYFDENGVLTRLAGSAAPGSPCNASAFPWSQGGNTSAYLNTIGTCDGIDFILKSNNITPVFLKPNGYVGIGINNSSPAAPFDLFDGNTSGNTDHLRFYANTLGAIESTSDMNLLYKSSGGFFISAGSLTGSSTLKLALNSGGMSLYSNLGVSGQVMSTNGLFESNNNNDASQALNVHNSVTNKTNFLVYTSGKTQLGTQTNAVNAGMLNLNLNSGSGTSSADNAIDVYDQFDQKVNFRVKGSGFVYAREVNLQLTPFPDYVFEKSYKLKSLDALENYIKQNKHLPGVPTALEIKENGANMGELTKIQMEKIEELTLYIIELNKKVEDLQQQVKNK